jgi:hypothetical protein
MSPPVPQTVVIGKKSIWVTNKIKRDMIVATEIIDDILKGAVKTDNNSTKRKHSVTDKTFVTCLTWKEKFPWLCKVEKNGIPYLQCTECMKKCI